MLLKSFHILQNCFAELNFETRQYLRNSNNELYQREAYRWVALVKKYYYNMELLIDFLDLIAVQMINIKKICQEKTYFLDILIRNTNLYKFTQKEFLIFVQILLISLFIKNVLIPVFREKYEKNSKYFF